MIKVKSEKSLVDSLLRKLDKKSTQWRVVENALGESVLPKEFFETDEGLGFLLDIEQQGKIDLIFDAKDFK